MGFLDYAVIVGYLLLSVYIGCRFSAKQKNTEDFFLAGRSMNWWPIAISIFASLFSAISFIAMPGEAYNFGCNMWLGGFVGIIALPVMLFVFLNFFYHMRMFTINEYLEGRFSPRLRTINSLIFLLIRGVYLGVVLYATGILLKSVFGWPMWLSILIIGVVSTVYTYFGGMSAVIWTDVMQFLVLLGGILGIIIFIALETPGGLAGIWNLAAEHNRAFDLSIDSGIWNFDLKQRIVVWVWLLSLPIAIIGPSTDQMNLQRCFSCKDYREVVRAVGVSTLGQMPICFIFYFAGMALYVYFKILHADTLPQDLNGDEAFSYFSARLLPIGLRGLLIAGLLAAVMSTISAVINSLGAVFVKDIYQPLIKPGQEEKHYLRVARQFTLWSGIFSCLFGISVDFIFGGRKVPLLEVSNVCLGVLGTFSMAMFFMGLLTYRTNSRGMLVGLAAGIPVAVYLTFFRYLWVPPEERMGFMYLSIITLSVIVAISYLCSLIFGGNNPSASKYVIWSRYFKRR